MRAAIPITLESDEALFEAAWKALKPERPEEVRLLIINNTLHLGELWVSENLADEVGEREGVEVVGEPFTPEFDPEGRMILQGR